MVTTTTEIAESPTSIWTWLIPVLVITGLLVAAFTGYVVIFFLLRRIIYCNKGYKMWLSFVTQPFTRDLELGQTIEETVNGKDKLL